jgi:hypothetical protein
VEVCTEFLGGDVGRGDGEGAVVAAQLLLGAGVLGALGLGFGAGEGREGAQPVIGRLAQRRGALGLGLAQPFGQLPGHGVLLRQARAVEGVRGA